MIYDFQKNAKALWTGVFLFAALTVLDQITKGFAQRVFNNSAFAFSLPLQNWLIYFFYALAVSVMGVYLAKNHTQLSSLQKFAWVLVVSGGLSNIGERLVLGYVRDWIYIFSGIFNFADFYIISGVVLLLIFNPSKQQT